MGAEGFIQSTVCIGMAPYTSAFDLVIQVRITFFNCHQNLS